MVLEIELLEGEHAVRGMWCQCENTHKGLQYGVEISNGKDIEAKRNNTSIIGVFSVSKRNKMPYSRTRSEAKRSEDYYFSSLQDRRNNKYI